MKKLIILVLLFISYCGFSQGRPTIPIGTFPVPNGLTAYSFIAQNAKADTIWFWSVIDKAWKPFVSNGSGGGSIDSASFNLNQLTIYRPGGLGNVRASFDTTLWPTIYRLNTLYQPKLSQLFLDSLTKTFTADITNISKGLIGLSWYNGNGTHGNISDLLQPVLGTLSAGQLLRWNGGVWENWTPNYLTSADVPNKDSIRHTIYDIASGSVGDGTATLTYTKWNGVTTPIRFINGGWISSPTNGQILTYNSSLNSFVNTNPTTTTLTSLGLTAWAQNLVTTANPSAVRYIKINADNTTSLVSAEDFLTGLNVGFAVDSLTVFAKDGGSNRDTILINTAYIATIPFLYDKIDSLAAALEGGLPDGDLGDISKSGTTLTIDNGVVTNAKVAAGIDAGKLADGSVSNTELQYINSLTSNAQTQINTKLAISDTANKWINNSYKRSDSFFYKKGATEVFIGKDSVGGGNLIYEHAGNGENLLYDSSDVLIPKRIIGSGGTVVSTLSDSTIQVATNLSSYPTRTELQDTASAIRDDIGSGLVFAGPYGDGESPFWFDTTINRLSVKWNNLIFHFAITDSVDGTTYDVDAQSYIDDVQAAGVTLTVSQKQAINNYVLGLKSDGLWTLIYDQGLPVWGTAAASAVMLKGTHTTTWVNSPTFGSTGVTGNGTNQYGNLNFSPSTAYASQDNAHIAVYLQNDSSNSNMIDIGAVSVSPVRIVRIIGRAGLNASSFINDNTAVNQGVASSAGLYLTSRVSSAAQVSFKNGSLLVGSGASTSTGLSSENIYILASNQVGSPGLWSTRTMSLWSIGAGLTNTQAVNLSSRINTLMTALGINIY